MPISTAPPSRKSKMGAPDSPSGPTDRRDHEAAQPHDQHGPTSRALLGRSRQLGSKPPTLLRRMWPLISRRRAPDDTSTCLVVGTSLEPRDRSAAADYKGGMATPRWCGGKRAGGVPGCATAHTFDQPAGFGAGHTLSSRAACSVRFGTSGACAPVSRDFEPPNAARTALACRDRRHRSPTLSLLTGTRGRTLAVTNRRPNDP